ncbi:MAG TPA: putative baseplate assembly protein [Niabella sp.]|nr:putative baseplate assembly protein [Niabella sp.]
MAVLEHPTINGIDFIEVIDDPGDPDSIRQKIFAAYFLKELPPNVPDLSNIRINGGIRIKGIKPVEAIRADLHPSLPASITDADASVLIVRLNKAGDFSTYQFQLIKNESEDASPEGFDPLLSTLDFSFKNSCPSEFDCKSYEVCDNRNIIPAPEINYLAKDYASIKQLLLDRMALTIPEWKERNAADMGIMLVELLAYTADYLNYRQDAISTEAYLRTARHRISVKRHARLVDYNMHDGCSARTWVHIEVKDGVSGITLKGNTNGNSVKFVTAMPQKQAIIKMNSSEADELFRQKRFHVFEPMQDLELDSKLNKLFFYTWGQSTCQLKKGATSATLDGHIHGLEGKYLVILEAVNPQTFLEADADTTKRHVIKVVSANLTNDLLGDPNSLPEDPLGRQITEITWGKEDALPFAFCLNTTDNEGNTIDTSTLIGNVLLADHGNTIEEALKFIEADRTLALKYGPLSSTSIIKENVSAAATIKIDLQKVLPSIELFEANAAALLWEPANDLISVSFNSRLFVVDVNNTGKAQLRFGNNINGQSPTDGQVFKAVYRVGNGIAGNIAPGSLKHLVSNDANISADTIVGISNPLKATGGTDPEKIEEVKYKAPIAFRHQERAVTIADYEEKSRAANNEIQRTTASLRWTGSWRTVFLSVDTFNAQEMDRKFIKDLEADLEKYRMAGQDLEIEKPKYVSLEIEIDVCIKSNYSRSDVKKVLLEILSNRQYSDGSKGLFHPDNFTFGQTVYLSKIYSTIQKVPDVLSVTIKKFQRLGNDNSEALESGKLIMGRTEIARLDNDPSALEKGILTINMFGGS